jgi:hypothetical protein
MRESPSNGHKSSAIAVYGYATTTTRGFFYRQFLKMILNEKNYRMLLPKLVKLDIRLPTLSKDDSDESLSFFFFDFRSLKTDGFCPLVRQSVCPSLLPQSSMRLLLDHTVLERHLHCLPHQSTHLV